MTRLLFPLMNNQASACSTPRAPVLAALWFAAGCGLIPSAPAAGTETSASAPYVLFVGMNLEVSEGGKFLPVTGAATNRVEVQQNHQAKQIELRKAEAIRITRGVKLSTLKASVADLQVDQQARAASMEALQASMAVMGEYQDQMQRQLGGMVRAGYLGSPDARPDARIAAMAAAEESYSSSAPGIAQNMQASDLMIRRQINDTSRGVVDTFNVAFDLSSERPIGAGYVALVTDFTVPGKDEVLHYRVATKAFDGIGTKPRRFDLSQSGFPLGFLVKGHHVHLFADGQEIVTNLSDKQVPLSRKEAEQYLMLQYVLSHPGETRTARAYPMVPEPELRRSIDARSLPPVVYVDVDAEGAVLGLYADAAGQQKLSEQGQAAMQGLAFYPALEKGAPVKGRASVVIADLLR